MSFPFRLVILVGNAEKERREACGTSVFYGVADNIVTRSPTMIIGERLLGDKSRSNPAGKIFQVAVNGGATFIWLVTIAADHSGAGFQRFRLSLSHKCQPMTEGSGQVIAFRLGLFSDWSS